MPYYKLIFKVKFDQGCQKTEPEVKNDLNDILLFFKPLCELISANISTDYANEFIEGENKIHSIIYLTIIKTFKTYPLSFHTNSALIHFCELIRHSGLSHSFDQDSYLLKVEIN